MYISSHEFEDVFKTVENYNTKIEELICERYKYMESVMDKVSPYKIGDEYVNVKTGERVKVTEIYRGTQVGNSCHYNDNSMYNIHARFDNGDNTSRYCYEDPYISAKDFEEKSKAYYEKLENFIKFN